MRNLIGFFFLALPFLAIFGAIAFAVGFIEALTVFCGAILFIGFMYACYEAAQLFLRGH